MIGKTILWVVIGELAFVALTYLCSRVQMKAWLDELDLKLGKKFVEYVNKKQKDDTQEN
jgi:hypothetical protein